MPEFNFLHLFGLFVRVLSMKGIYFSKINTILLTMWPVDEVFLFISKRVKQNGMTEPFLEVYRLLKHFPGILGMKEVSIPIKQMN